MNQFIDKKILILGLGLNQGGVGSAKFFAKQGAKVKVTDLKNREVLKPSLDQLKDFPNIEFTLGEHKNDDIDWADLIIKNPSVKPANPYIEYAKKKGKQIETDMGIFLQFIKPSQIIGVTGTKGKSTTASLIYEILKAVTHQSDQKSAGVNINPPRGCTFTDVFLTGNIGKSVLDTIPKMKPDTLVVLEISSFQLEAFEAHQVSPKWAVITNIYPDHLNYYKSMDEYIQAKKIIGRYQKDDDFLFIRKGDPMVDNSKFLGGFKAKIIRSSKNNLPKDFHPHLMGEHNLENMAAALSVIETLGIKKQMALSVMQNFKGIPFRMELIKNWRGVKIINDTTATGPDVGIKALQTFPNCILIAGGMNKNMPYEEYIKAINKYAKKVFFLKGDVTDLIRTSTPGVAIQTFGPYNDLEKLLTDVKTKVAEGDIILFSPAATSFNLFQNEFDRGRKFNEIVKKIFK